MHFSGLQVTSWVVLLVATGCLEGALFTDFWSTHHPRQSMDGLRMHRGLFKQCITTIHQSTCHFRFANIVNKINDYMDMGLSQRIMAYQHEPPKAFEFVLLLLFICAQAFSTFILICGPYCCTKCKCCTVYVAILAGLSTIIGCAIYAYYNTRGQTFTLRQTIYQDVFNYDFGSDVNELAWSFYMAVVAGVLYVVGVVILTLASPPTTVDYETVSAV